MRFALAVSLASIAAAQTLTITHVNLIDITNGKIRPDTTVSIEANRIVNVSASTSRNPPRGIIDR